jgi:hypothetical protein
MDHISQFFISTSDTTNNRLNFQIYSSTFHSVDPLFKQRTYATTFALRKKNAADQTILPTAKQRRNKEHCTVLSNASYQRTL